MKTSMVQVSVTHMVKYTSVFCFAYQSLALPKTIEMSRITHRDSWKPEIKLLSAKRSQTIHIILNGSLDI